SNVSGSRNENRCACRKNQAGREGQRNILRVLRQAEIEALAVVGYGRPAGYFPHVPSLAVPCQDLPCFNEPTGRSRGKLGDQSFLFFHRHSKVATLATIVNREARTLSIDTAISTGFLLLEDREGFITCYSPGIRLSFSKSAFFSSRKRIRGTPPR